MRFVPYIEKFRVAGAAASSEESQRHVESNQIGEEATAAAKLPVIFEAPQVEEGRWNPEGCVDS